jgi:hypothetical protein
MEKVLDPQDFTDAGFEDDPTDCDRFKYWLCSEETIKKSAEEGDEFDRPCLCFGAYRNVWEYYIIDIQGNIMFLDNFDSPLYAVAWAKKIESFEPYW